MILFITGASHTVKTLAAQRLLEKYHYPYLSIDHLKMGLIRSGFCPLLPESSVEELTAYLWRIVKEMIRTALENSQNLIVEGCYIPLDWKRDFTAGEQEQIRCVCLVFSEDYIRGHFHDILRYADVIEKRGDEACYTQEWLLRENAYYRAMCEQYGVDMIQIDGQYDVSIEL